MKDTWNDSDETLPWIAQCSICFQEILPVSEQFDNTDSELNCGVSDLDFSKTIFYVLMIFREKKYNTLVYVKFYRCNAWNKTCIQSTCLMHMQIFHK